MKLYGGLASPYVARVVLFARLKGIALAPQMPAGGITRYAANRINEPAMPISTAKMRELRACPALSVRVIKRDQGSAWFDATGSSAMFRARLMASVISR